MDLSILQQGEATKMQYAFCFIVVNIIFFICFMQQNSKKTAFYSWILMLFFCIYAYWDTDYFTFKQSFYISLKDFRDPLYYYLSFISFNSYSIFRLLIWGTALFLVVRTIKRLFLPQNLAAFIFSVFFLLTFSYARVSLGMAMYFYGASLLFNPSLKYKHRDKFLGLLFVLGSILGHRSMALIILMTPFCYIKMSKLKVVLFIAVTIIAALSFKVVILSIAAGSFGGNLGAVGEAAAKYSSMGSEISYNWKFTLIRNLRYYSIYILAFFTVWKIYFAKTRLQIDNWVKNFMTLCMYIFAIAYCFMSTGMFGADIIGYRYLYMMGIPLCIILCYLVHKGFCSKIAMYLMFIPAILYAEGFIFGKILSF